MLGYAGQPAAIPKILAAMPKTNENQELQLHYLYALRMIKQGWTRTKRPQLAEVLGRASKWRGGAQFINFVGQFFDSVSDLYATDDEKQLLYEKAPDFSPLTPTELADIQARQAAPRRLQGAVDVVAGAAERRRPLAARTAGRVLSRQEMFEETVYQPQQVLDVDAGRKAFEANCASCHKFGSVGTDHGVASLNLSASPLRSSKAALLEAVFFPNRKLAPEHETTTDRNDRRKEDQRAGAEGGGRDRLDPHVRRHGDRSARKHRSSRARRRRRRSCQTRLPTRSTASRCATSPRSWWLRRQRRRQWRSS